MFLNYCSPSPSSRHSLRFSKPRKREWSGCVLSFDPGVMDISTPFTELQEHSCLLLRACCTSLLYFISGPCFSFSICHCCASIQFHSSSFHLGKVMNDIMLNTMSTKACYWRPLLWKLIRWFYPTESFYKNISKSFSCWSLVLLSSLLGYSTPVIYHC